MTQNHCTCASFFTVRGTHKPDCPFWAGLVEESWEEECIDGAPWTQESRALHTKIKSLLASQRDEIQRKMEAHAGDFTEEDDGYFGRGFKHAVAVLAGLDKK